MGLAARQPGRWVAAWRHVVTVFRNSDAINVTWLWVISGDNRATGQLRNWWPGPRYVDWVGVDGYYFTPADTFKSVIGNTVRPSGSSPASRSCSPRSASGRAPQASEDSRPVRGYPAATACWA